MHQSSTLLKLCLLITLSLVIHAKAQDEYELGALAYKRGDYDTAIRHYTNHIRENPKSYGAYNNRGNAWDAKGEYDNAIKDYNEAIRLNPKNELAYNNRGNAWKAKGEYQKALDDYNQLIQLDREDPDAWNSSAWLRATCPDPMYRDGEKAVKNARKACELSQWKVSNHIGTLACAYAETGDIEKAILYTNQAIEMRESELKANPNNEIEKTRLQESRKHLEYFKQKKPWREYPKDKNKSDNTDA